MGKENIGIRGHLSDFSLGELLRFLEQGKKSGCLSLDSTEKQQVAVTPAKLETLHLRYIERERGAPLCRLFFSDGQIVAATHSSNHKGLQYLIEKRSLLRETSLQRLLQVRPLTSPLGIYLKEQGILTSEDLQLLFKQQVLTPIPRLFALKEGWFEFSPSSSLPLIEMTGLRASPTSVALTGLRLLKDWTPLLDKLPLATSTLVSVIEGRPPYHLNPQEWQIWEYVNSNLTLQELAEHLSMALLEVQKATFRLMVAGLVEEVPKIDQEDPTIGEPNPDSPPAAQPLSEQFLHRFLNFLRAS
ncbi:DUF4388 domain-containing protein [Thermosynechococcus sp.]|uniref:DUF4388 domain-containing protein n=1 Tax=Thermosynechococcus sp. TaxID=2814275 RepID=UPI00391B8058